MGLTHSLVSFHEVYKESWAIPIVLKGAKYADDLAVVPLRSGGALLGIMSDIYVWKILLI